MKEPSEPGTTTVELAVTSDTECIPAVRRSCQELASAIGFDAEQSKMIMLVMDEALSKKVIPMNPRDTSTKSPGSLR